MFGCLLFATDDTGCVIVHSLVVAFRIHHVETNAHDMMYALSFVVSTPHSDILARSSTIASVGMPTVLLYMYKFSPVSKEDFPIASVWTEQQRGPVTPPCVTILYPIRQPSRRSHCYVVYSVPLVD